MVTESQLKTVKDFSDKMAALAAGENHNDLATAFSNASVTGLSPTTASWSIPRPEGLLKAHNVTGPIVDRFLKLKAPHIPLPLDTKVDPRQINPPIVMTFNDKIIELMDQYVAREKKRAEEKGGGSVGPSM